MTFLDLLAKLGILRFGTKKAVYRSGKDMPTEFLMNDVVNAERDLTTAADLKAFKEMVSGKTTETRFCPQCGKPVGAADGFCRACGVKMPDA